MELGAQVTRRDEVVAVEGDVIEICRNTEPAGYGCPMNATHMRVTGHDHVALTQRPAYQDDLQTDGGIHGKFLRAKEIDAGGANIAGHKGDREVLNNSFDTVQL